MSEEVWLLKALRRTYTPNSWNGGSDLYSEEEVVATFDSKRKAEKYIKDSTLKHPKVGNRFRNKSLLGHWEDAWVEKKEEEIPPPHNPTI